MPHLPIGKHLVRVKSTALGITGTNKTQIAIEFEPADENMVGHATWYGYFTEAALPYTLKTLAVCGWDKQASNGDVASLHDSPLLVGNEVEIVIDEKLDNDGKPRLKVQWVNEPGGGGALKNKLDPEQAKRVGAELRQKILTASVPAPTRAPSRPAEPDPKDDDYSIDDIPF